MEVKCKVDFGGIEEKLIALGPKLARKTLRKACGKVGDMWVEQMKSRVPVDHGDLRDCIGKKVTTRKKGNAGIAKVSVGPMYGIGGRKPGDSSQQPQVYARFVELGTKDTPREPFMRPVFDATADKAVELFARVLREDLDDLVKGS